MTPEMQIDGQPATASDLGYFVTSNYGAFTSLVVEDGGVRGLDLHLARLHQEAMALFGQAVPEQELRLRMRQALAGRAGRFGLRINLFSPDISLRQPDLTPMPWVLTTLTMAPEPLSRPARVQTQVYEREQPYLKHNATLGLTMARRRARMAGYDDALFLTRDGFIAEGSVWNLGLVQGDLIIWPDAPQLAGTGMGLLQRGLSQQGLNSQSRPVHVDELDQFDGAFLTNATTPVAPIASINGHDFHNQPHLMTLLYAAWRSNPCQII